MRVLNPGWRRWPAALDIFPNHRLVPKIKCPVLIMHVRWLGWLGAVRPCGWVVQAQLGTPQESRRRGAAGVQGARSTGWLAGWLVTPDCRTKQVQAPGWPTRPGRTGRRLPAHLTLRTATAGFVQGLEDEVIDVQHGRQASLAWLRLLCLHASPRVERGRTCRGMPVQAGRLPAPGGVASVRTTPRPPQLRHPLTPRAAAQAVPAAQRAAVGAAARPPGPRGQPRWVGWVRAWLPLHCGWA